MSNDDKNKLSWDDFATALNELIEYHIGAAKICEDAYEHCINGQNESLRKCVDELYAFYERNGVDMSRLTSKPEPRSVNSGFSN